MSEHGTPLEIPGWKHVYSGKVRELYVPDESRLSATGVAIHDDAEYRAEAAKVHGSDALLIGYFRDGDAMASRYLADVTPDELARVIDDAWDPPVTVAVRLVSIVDDCAQHLGAAAYLKGALLPD